MDFIERTFGVSPDGGSGSFEVVLTLALFLVFMVLMRFMRSRRSLVGGTYLHGAHTVWHRFADAGRHTIQADDQEVWVDEDGR